MSPERAREEYHAWRTAWKRHGVATQLRGSRFYAWRIPRYGPPTDPVVVPMERHAPDVNLDRMRAAVNAMLERPTKPSANASSVPAVSDPQMQQRCPLLWEYLTSTVFADGSKREPSTLLVFLQDGSLKAMLRDKEGERCLWVAGRSLVGLLDALDGQLADPMADWRPDRKAKGESAPRGRRAG